MLKNIIFFTLVLILIFGTIMPVLAQEEATTSATEIEVVAEDLDVGSTSWLSRLWREVRITFTADPVKKAELELKKANVDLWRAKLEAETNQNVEQLQERLQTRLNNFQEVLNRVTVRVQNYIEKNPENERAQKFLDKLTDQELKQQEVLQKIADQVPEAVAQKIQERRQEHLDQFGQVMERLQNKEQLKARLHSLLEDGTETIDRQMNRVEILERVREQRPQLEENIKEFQEENKILINEIKDNYKEVLKNREQLKDNVRTQAREGSSIEK